MATGFVARATDLALLQKPVESLAAFVADLKDSSLPVDHELVPAHASGSWPDAFRALAPVLPDSPVIVVIDELPWLAEQDGLFDGALQTAWDWLLSGRPVLLLLLGSDIHCRTGMCRSGSAPVQRP